MRVIDISAPHASRLTEVLDRFRAIDCDTEACDFDPAVVIDDLKNEIDAIKLAADMWRSEAEMLQVEWIAPLVARKNRLLGRREKLLAWLKDEMERGSDGQPYLKLPGQAFQATLTKAPPALKIDEEATAVSYGKYPGYVRVSVGYVWDKERIKERLDNGEPLEFARITQGRYVKFYAREKKGAGE